MTAIETYKALDKAIDAHVKATGEDGSFVTGWVLSISMSSPGFDDEGRDGYATYVSDGLPHHAQVGLLEVAKGERDTIALMGTMMAYLNQMGYSNNDDDDEKEE